VLHDVFEKIEIFFYNFQPFLDVSESHLQVEGIFQAYINLIQDLIFPGNIRRIKDVQVFCDLILQVQGPANILLQVLAGNIQLSLFLEYLCVVIGFFQQRICLL